METTTPFPTESEGKDLLLFGEEDHGHQASFGERSDEGVLLVLPGLSSTSTPNLDLSSPDSVPTSSSQRFSVTSSTQASFSPTPGPSIRIKRQPSISRRSSPSPTLSFSSPAWLAVEENIAKMDSLYDASFSSWIRNESHLHISATHIRRIFRDYTDAQVVNGLTWLVSDWTLGSITRFLEAVIVKDLWISEIDESVDDNVFRKRKSDVLPNASELWMPSALFSRNVGIIAALISSWTMNFTSEILLSFLKSMSLDQKQRFMAVFLKDWGFSKVSELFMHMGSRVEWDLKINALKMSHNSSFLSPTAKRGSRG